MDERAGPTVDVLAAAATDSARPADDGWTVRGVPMAPFPARLRIDDERSALWHDVVAAEVVPPVAVEAVVEDIELPRPEVRLMVGEARWLVALSYPLPLARADASEVAGLLSAGPLYAARSRRPRWAPRQALACDARRAWVRRGQGFPHDPRDLLQGGAVVPWPELASEPSSRRA
jgi:hypothetical protein